MYNVPTEAISASQISKRSFPEMSYMDFSNNSMPFECGGEEVASMFNVTRF